MINVDRPMQETEEEKKEIEPTVAAAPPQQPIGEEKQ